MTEEIADELYIYLIIGSSISRIVVECVSISTQQFGEWMVSDKKQAFTILKEAFDPGNRTKGTADTTQMRERLLGGLLKDYPILRQRWWS